MLGQVPGCLKYWEIIDHISKIFYQDHFRVGRFFFLFLSDLQQWRSQIRRGGRARAGPAPDLARHCCRSLKKKNHIYIYNITNIYNIFFF